jgi:CubicO group peptidase (beta-lactamase class C family)
MNRRDFVVGSATAVAGTVLPRRSGTDGLRATLRSPLRFDPKHLQALLDESANALGVVGAQLAIFDGQTISEFSTGLADRERNLRVTADTLFQIGSTTKVFNATLIMTLVDEGKLDLDAPVKTWIPSFAVPSPDATNRITIRQLISMSSGIDNGPYQDYGRGDDALERYVAALAPIPLTFEPGQGFGYSNAGISVAGLAAQRVMGHSWEVLLRDRVLKPVGLTQTASFAEELLFHPVALGYARRAGSTEPTRIPFWGLPRSIAPAGGTLCASAGDLIRLARMFLSDGTSTGGTAVLSPASIKTMHTPVVTLPAKLIAQRWCCGPYWKEWGGVELFGHSGTNSGGSSTLIWCPSKRFAIATVANVANQQYPLADRIFDTVFPELFGVTKPKLPTVATIQPASVDLRRYLGRFEAWGTAVTFSDDGGKLVARVYQGRGNANREPQLVSEIVPMGDDRFLPVDPAMGGNRGWGVAFWGSDSQGRATHFLNGVFANRRVD